MRAVKQMEPGGEASANVVEMSPTTNTGATSHVREGISK
jgi:hypothetical protein